MKSYILGFIVFLGSMVGFAFLANAYSPEQNEKRKAESEQVYEKSVAQSVTELTSHDPSPACYVSIEVPGDFTGVAELANRTKDKWVLVGYDSSYSNSMTRSRTGAIFKKRSCP